jgi:hypothetical protein
MLRRFGAVDDEVGSSLNDLLAALRRREITVDSFRRSLGQDLLPKAIAAERPLGARGVTKPVLRDALDKVDAYAKARIELLRLLADPAAEKDPAFSGRLQRAREHVEASLAEAERRLGPKTGGR